MSGRANVLAENASASSNISRAPSQRDGLGLGGGGGRVPGGSQRPRQQVKKHPEPLRRAVADCLSSSHHVFPTEALRTVQDYLANSMTVDSAYSVLIDHALAERGRSPPVITKCVSLLKKYLFRYYPRASTLRQIDAFCVSIIAECNAYSEPASKRSYPWVQPVSDMSNFRVTGMSPGITTSTFASAALVKSLNFVRALVLKHLPNHGYGGASSPSLSKPLTPATMGSPRPGSLKRGMLQDRDRSKVAVNGMDGLEEVEHEDLLYVAVDVLKWRWAGSSGQLPWAPSPVMLDSGGIARPHVERLPHLGEQGAAALLLRGIDRKDMGSASKKQVERNKITSLEGGILTEQVLRPSSLTSVSDHGAARSHLRAIAAAKRKNQPSPRWDGETAAGTARRRARPLFQYRYYSEQQPLKLSEAEMEEVVSAVCAEAITAGSTASTPAHGTQAGKVAVEAADVAASVLIKLLIDMYMADSRAAAPLTLSLLQGMLSSPQAAVRVRAFDLALNLGVHAHLLEPMQSDDQSFVEEPSQPSGLTGGSFSSVLSAGDLAVNEKDKIAQENGGVKGIEKPEKGTPAAVGVFEAWLLDIVCEMLLYLVQAEETEEGVWSAALSCFLYLVCDRGRICRKRLAGLDIRVLSSLLEVSWMHAWADEVHCRLIRMACNLLYRQPEVAAGEILSRPSLDLDQLYLMGGVEVICNEYARARTAESKQNLFAVLLDFVLHDLQQAATICEKEPPSIEEVQAVVSALCLADAPESFALAFKQGLQGVGDNIAKSIGTAMSRDVTNGRLNAQLLDDITASLDALATAHVHPDSSFEHLIKATMMSEGLTNADAGGGSPISREKALDSAVVTKAWATLRTLLHSPHSICRSNGYAWLLELLCAEMARGGSKQSSKLNTHALQRQLSLLGSLERATEAGTPQKTSETPTISSAARLLCGLLKAKQPVVRRGFVLILEKLLLHCQRPGLEIETPIFAGEGETKDGSRSSGAQDRALAMLGLMNGALWQVISANDTNRINILQMCNMMFSQLCVKWPPAEETPTCSKETSSGTPETVTRRDHEKSLDISTPERTATNDNMINNNLTNVNGDLTNSANYGQVSSMATMLLNGQAASSKSLVANMPTALLYWPLMQLASSANEDVALGVAVGSRGGGIVEGGACDVRAALLLLLIGKCSTYQAALEEVGGEEFFRGLLDDSDARIAYYTSAFLLKRMMREEPEAYQHMLHNLVFKAQQSNNEKLLENPYLQMHGILQLSSEMGNTL